MKVIVAARVGGPDVRELTALPGSNPGTVALMIGRERKRVSTRAFATHLLFGGCASPNAVRKAFPSGRASAF